MGFLRDSMGLHWFHGSQWDIIGLRLKHLDKLKNLRQTSRREVVIIYPNTWSGSEMSGLRLVLPLQTLPFVYCLCLFFHQLGLSSQLTLRLGYMCSYQSHPVRSQKMFPDLWDANTYPKLWNIRWILDNFSRFPISQAFPTSGILPVYRISTKNDNECQWKAQFPKWYPILLAFDRDSLNNQI